MNPLPADQTCPVDLDFTEPHPAQLDLTSIVGRGKSIRRRRRVANAGAAVVVCAAAASVVVGVRGASFHLSPPAAASPPGVAAKPIDAQVAADPPVTGKLTLLSNFPAGSATVAWATRQGEVCWATYRTPGTGETEDFQCPGWSGTEIPGPGRPGLSDLQFSTGSFGGSSTTLEPAFGLAAPRATRVTVTFFGRSFSAKVVPVPLGGGKTVGVYLVWLRVPASASGYGTSDLGRSTAYDAAGHIVAQHGPGGS